MAPASPWLLAHGCPSFLHRSPGEHLGLPMAGDPAESRPKSSRPRHRETGASGKWLSPAKATVGCSLRVHSCCSLLGSVATSWELDRRTTSSVRLGGNRVTARGPGNTMVGSSAVLAPGGRLGKICKANTQSYHVPTSPRFLHGCEQSPRLCLFVGLNKFIFYFCDLQFTLPS